MLHASRTSPLTFSGRERQQFAFELEFQRLLDLGILHDGRDEQFCLGEEHLASALDPFRSANGNRGLVRVGGGRIGWLHFLLVCFLVLRDLDGRFRATRERAVPQGGITTPVDYLRLNETLLSGRSVAACREDTWGRSRAREWLNEGVRRALPCASLWCTLFFVAPVCGRTRWLNLPVQNG